MNQHAYSRDSYLLGLDPEQHAAVTAPFNRSILVLSGAGCGKTRVLTMRVLHSLRHFCNPSSLLAITFTRNAAAQMRQRLGSMIPATNARALHIATFHGLCYRILHDRTGSCRNYQRLGYTGSPRFLQKKDTLHALAACTTAAQRKDLQADVATIDSMVACARSNPRGFSQRYRQHAEMIKEIIDAYDTWKRQHNVWDFTDVIEKAMLLLCEHRECKTHYTGKFRAILVDEYQDVNPMQIALLKKMRGAHSSLFVVGDDDQAIYGFRGAGNDQMQRFSRLFPDPVTYKLQTNYRSHRRILARANRIFADKPADYRTILRPPAHTDSERMTLPAVVRCRSFNSREQMMEWIIASAGNICRRNRIAFDAIAILFRTNESVRYMYRWLQHTSERMYATLHCMTVHASKGMEFPVVFLCDLEDGIFPLIAQRSPRTKLYRLMHNLFSYKRDEDSTAAADAAREDEEKRLFYVGVTRAQFQLYCCSALRKKRGMRTRSYARSRFLRYI